jgi:hypothetical protein
MQHLGTLYYDAHTFYYDVNNPIQASSLTLIILNQLSIQSRVRFSDVQKVGWLVGRSNMNTQADVLQFGTGTQASLSSPKSRQASYGQAEWDQASLSHVYQMDHGPLLPV